MKKLIILALMATFTTASFAQLVTGRSATYAKTKTESKNWSYVYVQYNPGSFSPSEGSSTTFNAFSLGFNKNWSLSSSIPLFLESGLGLQYSFASKNKVDYKLLSFKIPVGLTYVYEIPNSPVAIIPATGLDVRLSPMAKGEINGHSYNLLSKSDMGSSDATWNVFQLGMHVGVNCRVWEKLLVGYAYQFDFTEIAKKVHVNQHNITIGYCF